MRRPMIAALVVAGVTLSACGDGDPSSGDDAGQHRTVEVDMVDIAFAPDTLEVVRGETVEFVFTNSGDVVHDAFVGDRVAQADHEVEMRASDDDGHGDSHDDEADDPAVTVDPDETGTLTYTFDQPGTIEIACHQPGHYEAEMVITVDVA